MTFNELNLKKPLFDAVTKAGYKEPSPIQEKAIPAVMAGKDMIACAQTGTGKTAAFALPMLNNLEELKNNKVRALVVTPTRELAQQIFDNMKKYSRYMKLRSVVLYGGAKQGPQIGALARGCDIIIATPGRLIDFMNQGLVSLSDIEMLVLDEADRMLDMGFIGDIRKIAAKTPADRQTVMFSATMPKEIERLAKELLTDPVDIRVAPTSSPADTVDQKITYTEKVNKKYVLSSCLKMPGVKKSIVFTRTKHGADRLVKDLKNEGITSLSIHGDKTQGQRQNALERFRSGNIKVLVATDVAARGIDIPKITNVFNYDLPDEAESYIHRIGRAGRAGENGEALSICCEDEMDLLYDIERLMKKEIPTVETEWSVQIEKKTRATHSRSRKRPGNRANGAGGQRKRSGFRPQAKRQGSEANAQAGEAQSRPQRSNSQRAAGSGEMKNRGQNYGKSRSQNQGQRNGGYKKRNNNYTNSNTKAS